MYLSPQVGVKGFYGVLPPFVLEDSPYECTNVATMKSLIISGVNVYDVFFKPYGLSKTEYDVAYQSNDRIITLTSDSGEELELPEYYVNSIPLIDNVIYGNKSLVVELGEMPLDIDLSNIVNVIKEQAILLLGVEARCTKVSLKKFRYVTAQEHNLITAKRKLYRDKKVTTLKVIETLRNELSAALLRNSALEELLTR